MGGVCAPPAGLFVGPKGVRESAGIDVPGRSSRAIAQTDPPLGCAGEPQEAARFFRHPVLVFESGCIDHCVDQLVPSVEASMETRRTGRKRQRRQQAQAPRIGGLRSAVAQTGNGPQETATGLGISERRAQRASAPPESRTSLPALRVSGVMRCPFPPIPRALASPISPASWVENSFIENGSPAAPRDKPFHSMAPFRPAVSSVRPPPRPETSKPAKRFIFALASPEGPPYSPAFNQPKKKQSWIKQL